MLFTEGPTIPRRSIQSRVMRDWMTAVLSAHPFAEIVALINKKENYLTLGSELNLRVKITAYFSSNT